MLKVYKRRLVLGLIALMLLFFLIFVIAFLDLNRGAGILSTKLPYKVENYGVMILSLLSIAKVIYEIYRIEH